MKTRREMVILWNVLNSIKVEKSDPKFTYAISKNKKKLESEIKILQEMDKPSDGFIKYEQDRMALCVEYAEKNEKDQPVIEQGNYKIEESKKDEFEKKLEELGKTNEEVLKEEIERKKDLQKFMDEDFDSNINLHMVPLSLCPDSISQEQMDYLVDTIIYDENESEQCEESKIKVVK